MKTITTAFIAEVMKLRRSRIFWITIIFFAFIPLMMGLMMFVALHPETAEKMGMFGSKASLVSKNNWSGYYGLLVQSGASISLIGFGFISSWVFGREYNDRTIKDILALPVSRSSIVISKFIVILLWCMLLSLVQFLVAMLIGQIIGIPEWSSVDFYDFIDRYFICSFLTALICSPVAFMACYSRGVIAPVGFVIVTLILSQLLGVVGLAPYFPWATPGLYAVSNGTTAFRLTGISYLIFSITWLAGLIGTISWWRFADQN